MLCSTWMQRKSPSLDHLLFHRGNYIPLVTLYMYVRGYIMKEMFVAAPIANNGESFYFIHNNKRSYEVKVICTRHPIIVSQ